MLRGRFPPRTSTASIAAVVIVGEDRGTETEGVIERVRQAGGQVDVRMLLSDGAKGIARLELHEWDWLELRVGDIVAVTVLSG